MNLSIICVLLFFTHSSVQTIPPRFKIPTTWTKDFRIYVLTGGGMQNQSESIQFTYDSCIYHNRLGTKNTFNKFALTPALRSEILKKLGTVHFDKIRTNQQPKAMILDKENTDICFYDTAEHCIEGDEVLINDIKIFSEAYQYLMSFSKRKK